MIFTDMEEILKHTATLPTATASPTPLPTVLPGDLPIVQHIHDTGKRTLWVVVVAMAISALAFYFLAARVRVQNRLVHTLTALVTTISFLSYLAMATGTGVAFKYSVVHHAHEHVPDTHEIILRQVFWVRYLNWILSTPLILINIALIGGLNGANLTVAIAADLVMFAAGLTATFTQDQRRWVWYAVVVVSFLTIGYQVGLNGFRSVRQGSDRLRSLFTSYTGANLLVVMLYPIVLAISPLTHRISVDAETVLFAIHDILVQGLFGYWLLLGHDSSESGQLFVDGFWANGISQEGAIRVGDSEGA